MTKPTLPISNVQRSAQAEQTLYRYAEIKEGAPGLYETKRAVLIDLLTDLMHLSRLNGLDFLDLSGEAEHYFFEEIAEEDGAINAVPPPESVRRQMTDDQDNIKGGAFRNGKL